VARFFFNCNIKLKKKARSHGDVIVGNLHQQMRHVRGRRLCVLLTHIPVRLSGSYKRTQRMQKITSVF
jgi:hypothetical protein